LLVRDDATKAWKYYNVFHSILQFLLSNPLN